MQRRSGKPVIYLGSWDLIAREMAGSEQEKRKDQRSMGHGAQEPVQKALLMFGFWGERMIREFREMEATRCF